MTSRSCPPPLHRHSPVDWLVSPLAWSAAGLFSLWQAHLHARHLDPFGGVICGDPSPAHCGWCYAAMLFIGLAAGLTAAAGLGLGLHKRAVSAAA